jgi:ubiquinone/menaquinone biosynthesis C-methylase UbiE
MVAQKRSKTYNKTQKAYDIWAKTYDTDPNPQLLLEHEDVIKMVLPRPGEVILDAACGTGRYAEEFHKSGARVFGLDFSKAMLAKAKAKKSGVKYQEHDLTRRLPFSNSSFNKIIIAQAIKHIKDPIALLREFNRCLKPGGIVVISVSHPEMVWNNYWSRFTMPDIADLKRSSVQYDWSMKEYKEMFKCSGFRLIKTISCRVGLKIKMLLTDETYKNAKGRSQIVIFKLQKQRLK